LQDYPLGSQDLYITPLRRIKFAGFEDKHKFKTPASILQTESFPKKKDRQANVKCETVWVFYEAIKNDLSGFTRQDGHYDCLKTYNFSSIVVFL
jgi:hypothetical protein